MRSWIAIVIALLLAAASSRPVAAQSKPKPSAVSAAQESAAIEFAEAHHPELADLLDRLKSADRNSYEKAVREIADTSERMANLRESDADRHGLVVRNWTLDSRVRLLMARLTMSDDPELRGELKKLLRERQDGRLALLRLDRDRAAARLKKLNSQIDELERGRDAAAERDLAKADRALKASTRKPAKPGDKKVKTATEKKPPAEKPDGDRK